MGVSVQSLMIVKETSVGRKRKLYTTVHGLFHLGAVPVVIVAGRSRVQYRNGGDLLVRSLYQRVGRSIGCPLTRILVGYPFLQVYIPQQTTPDEIYCCGPEVTKSYRGVDAEYIFNER